MGVYLHQGFAARQYFFFQSYFLSFFQIFILYLLFHLQPQETWDPSWLQVTLANRHRGGGERSNSPHQLTWPGGATATSTKGRGPLGLTSSPTTLHHHTNTPRHEAPTDIYSMTYFMTTSEATFREVKSPLSYLGLWRFNSWRYLSCGDSTDTHTHTHTDDS